MCVFVFGSSALQGSASKAARSARSPAAVIIRKCVALSQSHHPHYTPTLTAHLPAPQHLALAQLLHRQHLAAAALAHDAHLAERAAPDQRERLKVVGAQALALLFVFGGWLVVCVSCEERGSSPRRPGGSQRSVSCDRASNTAPTQHSAAQRPLDRPHTHTQHTQHKTQTTCRRVKSDSRLSSSERMWRCCSCGTFSSASSRSSALRLFVLFFRVCLRVFGGVRRRGKRRRRRCSATRRPQHAQPERTPGVALLDALALVAVHVLDVRLGGGRPTLGLLAHRARVRHLCASCALPRKARACRADPGA